MPYLKVNAIPSHSANKYKPICIEVLLCTYKQTDINDESFYLWDIFKLNFSDFYDTYNEVQW